ncbi:hypothetical protein FQZ97_993090 [compost metagenome]
MHQRGSDFKTRVEVHRANDGFQRVGQDRRTFVPPGTLLAVPEAQSRHQTETRRDLEQGVLLDQIRPHTGEIAFWQLAELLEQQARDGQIEHRVTEELQPFVVVGREAAVGQRALQQVRVGKVVVQALLQRLKLRIQRHGQPVGRPAGCTTITSNGLRTS